MDCRSREHKPEDIKHHANLNLFWALSITRFAQYLLSCSNKAPILFLMTGEETAEFSKAAMDAAYDFELQRNDEDICNQIENLAELLNEEPEPACQSRPFKFPRPWTFENRGEPDDFTKMLNAHGQPFYGVGPVNKTGEAWQLKRIDECNEIVTLLPKRRYLLYRFDALCEEFQYRLDSSAETQTLSGPWFSLPLEDGQQVFCLVVETDQAPLPREEPGLRLTSFFKGFLRKAHGQQS
jgi:hypothetical protein